MIKGIIFDMWGVLIRDEKQLMEDVPAVLQVLSEKYQLAVATSISRERMKEILGNLEVKEFFEAMSGGDDVTYNKPAADVYERSIELLGLLPEECLVVEDGEMNLVEIMEKGAKGVLVGRDISGVNELEKYLDNLS